MNKFKKEYSGRIIPKEWNSYKIGDIVTFEGGSQPPKSEFKYVYEEGYIRLIQIRDYKSDEYITFIPKKLAKKFCDETDILIGRYGPPIFQILRGIKGAYNVALMKAIPDENKVIKEYIYYYLQIESLFKLIDKLSRRSSGQTGVDIDALNNFGIPLPSREEQKEIVSLIKLAEEVVKKQEQLIEKKKEFKKGLMQRLLSGEVRFKEFNDKWKIVSLSNIFDRVTQKNETGCSNVLTISAQNGLISQEDYFNKSVSSKDLSAYYLLKNGDFAYNKSYSNGYPLGAIKRLNKYVEGVVSPLYICFRAKEKINTCFYEQYFESGFLNKEIFKIAQEGARNHGLLNVSVTEFFKDIKISKPSLEEQEKIATVLVDADKEIDLLQKELEALKLQKKGLMQRLLTGEVRVNL